MLFGLFRSPSVRYAQPGVISIILHGTLVASLIITILSLYYPVTLQLPLDIKHKIMIIGSIYLLLAEFLCYLRLSRSVAWILILFYSLLASVGFSLWGTSDVLGILAACFAIILTGILVGTSIVFPVTVYIVSILVVSHIIHFHDAMNVGMDISNTETWDVLLYATMLNILSLVTWLSYRQLENSIQRAQQAERSMRRQKESLKAELLKETAMLRQTQLDHMHQLHKFALLGQSAAATLHELSNHLSILNLDINDLRQHYTHSQAIENATNSITYINKMVRNSRQQLDSYDTTLSFDARMILKQITEDFEPTLQRSGIVLSILPHPQQPLPLKGSPLALMQVINILFTNAVEACHGIVDAKITISITRTLKHIDITLSDNGPGIKLSQIHSLFSPKTSSKPTGLGVGLYIAHRIIKDHFKGTINLLEADRGAHFSLQLPLLEMPERPKRTSGH
jgi:signal transduction histidine kinase